MKDNSAELIRLTSNLKTSLGLKLQVVSINEDLNDSNLTEINNISKKFFALEEYTKEAKNLFSSRKDIIVNFRKRANDILSEIDQL